MKLGEIGEEMVATAVKLAQERGAAVVALNVILVPLDKPLDAELFDEEERAAASLAEAAALGADHGVDVKGRSIRARSIGEAIVGAAEESGADLIVLGSSPVAPAVALLLADGRVRPPQSACGSAGRRVPSGRARRGLASYIPQVMDLKALVIGCGRVGSSVALQLHQEGWDVTVVDENEDALSRLGESWPGTFIVGHGMDAGLLREAGIEDADAVVVATDGDNTNIIIGQVAQKRFDVRCVVVRVLDPARAKFYAERGLETVCPTSVAIDRLLESARTCAIPIARPAAEEVPG